LLCKRRRRRRRRIYFEEEVTFEALPLSLSRCNNVFPPYCNSNIKTAAAAFEKNKYIYGSDDKNLWSGESNARAAWRIF